MGAPKGNKFWKTRSSHGRKPTFATPEDLWNACEEYFDWVEDNPLEEAIVYQGELNEKQRKPLMRAMTLDGLCVFLDITDQTFYNHRNKSKEFLEVVNKIDRVMRNQKFQGAAAGLLNPNIIARDLGLADKQEISNTHSFKGMSDEELERIAAGE